MKPLKSTLLQVSQNSYEQTKLHLHNRMPLKKFFSQATGVHCQDCRLDTGGQVVTVTK